MKKPKPPKKWKLLYNPSEDVKSLLYAEGNGTRTNIINRALKKHYKL